mmetsp:Transcript_15813/g.29399  ORF Transcript_15813/g.29399 Transcript_15813/m.29399 type:complete len:80 (-) Transcript_15813:685-924(-)
MCWLSINAETTLNNFQQISNVLAPKHIYSEDSLVPEDINNDKVNMIKQLDLALHQPACCSCSMLRCTSASCGLGASARP